MGLTLYGRDSSYNVQKVLWLLAEMELPFTHIQAGGKYGGNTSEQFAVLNPMQKVPVLVDSERSVWESNSILRYLTLAHGGDWRCDAAFQRSEYERWMDWAQATLEPAFVGVFWGYYRTPEPQRDIVAIEQSLQACHHCLQAIERPLQHSPFLASDRISLADVCCGVFIYRLVEIDTTSVIAQRRVRLVSKTTTATRVSAVGDARLL